jgi:hypothetical protein
MSFLKSAVSRVADKGEGILAKVPVLGPLLGAETEEQKELVRQQKRMAEDAKRRAELAGPARLQAMNQQVMAFAPRNKLMAEMFGPDAAFTGKQIGDMTANPMGAPQGDPQTAKLAQQLKKYGLKSYEDVLAFNKQTNSRLTDSQGFMKAMQLMDQQRTAEEAEKKRRAGLDAAFATGPGPAPIAPTQAAPVRRY